MEMVNQERRQEKSKSKEETKRSMTSLMENLRLAFRLTKDRYQNSLPTERESELWMEDWRHLAEQFGFDRFSAGLRLCYEELVFFPRPGEIRSRMPDYEQMPTANQVMRCGKCQPNGFREIMGRRNKTVWKCDHAGQRTWPVDRNSNGVDIADCERRQARGEEFFTIGDVFREYAKQVNPDASQKQKDMAAAINFNIRKFEAAAKEMQ